MKPPVVVQALDGRWLFGPPETEEAMRNTPLGKFDHAADASQAALTHDQTLETNNET